MLQRINPRFLEILQGELAMLARLEVVLGLEMSALERRDIDALTENTKEKQDLISSIEKLGRERRALLQGAGVATDKEAVQALVEAEPALRGQWSELESVLLRCQQQNQINGILLEKGKQQTRRLLGILLGEGNRKETELYDARGSTSPSFLHGRSVKV